MKQGEIRSILNKEFGNETYYSTQWAGKEPSENEWRDMISRCLRYRISRGRIYYLPPATIDSENFDDEVTEFLADGFDVDDPDDDEQHVNATKADVLKKWSDHTAWRDLTTDKSKAEFTLNDEFSIEGDSGWHTHRGYGPQIVTEHEYDYVTDKARLFMQVILAALRES